MTLDCVMLFSGIKNLGNANASIIVKVRGRIFFHVMVEIWNYLKDTLAFLSYLVC